MPDVVFVEVFSRVVFPCQVLCYETVLIQPVSVNLAAFQDQFALLVKNVPVFGGQREQSRFCDFIHVFP